MWDKNFRLNLIFLIYQSYYSDLHPTFLEDFIFGIENIPELEISNTEKDNLIEEYNLYLDKKVDYEIILNQYTKDWKNTYLFVRAILITFLLEKNSGIIIDKSVINKYIKICQSYIDSETSSLVHAILVKV
jgi:transcription termination factor NusB